MPHIRRSVILRSRPNGQAVATNFAVIEDEIPQLRDGEVLKRTLWLSIDPYMRGRMDDAASYRAPVRLGEPMTGETVGEVLESRYPAINVGDTVLGAFGWQSHVVTLGASLTVLPSTGAPYSTYLGVLGMPGATAFAGLRDIGKPKRGETLVVAAASGAVGSVVVQLAKRAGAQVVALAGGEEKCSYVREILGADECIDRRSVGDLSAALRKACPNGIDVYFESVGGAVQRAVFPLMNDFGRVVMCGMVAEYNDAEAAPGPSLRSTFTRRLHIQGFIVLDRPENTSDWREYAVPLVASGEIRYREQVVEGLENAPQALISLLTGSNEAKLVVHVAD